MPWCQVQCQDRGERGREGEGEVIVAGRLVYSRGGDGFADAESKFLKLVAAITDTLDQG